jgi:hypothetical protein
MIRIKVYIIDIVLLFFGISSTFGLVLQNGQPSENERPADGIVGAWNNTASFYSNGASCNVIGPDYILTTRHQGNGVGTIITIGGVNYTVAEVFPHSTADIRVARIIDSNGRPANLKFVGVYSKTDEVGQEIVIGGCGLGGIPYPNANHILYYSWEANNSNTTPLLRWGTNCVSSYQDNFSSVSPYTSDILTCTFTSIKSTDATTYEAAVANHDSGGGWFIKDTDGEWKVAGLSAYVSRMNYTYFSDYFSAIRVSSYASWLKENHYVLDYGDANRDGKVDVGDLGILAANYGMSDKLWDDGDFNADGCVDVGDLGLLAANYGIGTSGSDFSADDTKSFNTANESSESDSNPICSSFGLVIVTGLLIFILLTNVLITDLRIH